MLQKRSDYRMRWVNEHMTIAIGIPCEYHIHVYLLCSSWLDNNIYQLLLSEVKRSSEVKGS